MEWYYILLIVLAIIIVIYLAICIFIAFYIVNYLTKPYCMPYDEFVERMIKDNKLEKKFKDIYKQENFLLKTSNGYNLNVIYIPSNANLKKRKVIILVHGWTSSHLAMYIYAKIYLSLGFDVFMYDHRNHMFSDKKLTTMGSKEADDLQDVVNMVKEKLGNNIILGTHGESMGATTVMIHAGKYHSVNFVVEDCGYFSANELLKYQFKYQKHFPLYPTNLFIYLIFKIKTKVSFKSIDVNKYLPTCDDIPMLFNHGDNDRFVPTYMVYQCYDCKNGFKMINLYNCKRHACSVSTNFDLYKQDIINFLNKIDVL